MEAQYCFDFVYSSCVLVVLDNKVIKKKSVEELKELKPECYLLTTINRLFWVFLLVSTAFGIGFVMHLATYLIIKDNKQRACFLFLCIRMSVELTPFHVALINTFNVLCCLINALFLRTFG